HAASVRPEPESNSPNKNNPTKVRCIANQRNPISNNQSKLAKKTKPSKAAGRREVPHQDGLKQQTKTTKHTIEFSNNRLDCEEVPRFGATLPA
ncbi:hypothetical protein, partial [Mycolicibacterium sp. P1-18]|uniref:hypothetical protein n=1 Tax=Mycolicibacterium sp. P1-18 TaxID=2024615 RepID=UPI001A9102F1